MVGICDINQISGGYDPLLPPLFFPPSCVISARVGSQFASFLLGAGAGAGGEAGGRAAASLEHIASVVQRGEEAPASNGEVEKNALMKTSSCSGWRLCGRLDCSEIMRRLFL